MGRRGRGRPGMWEVRKAKDANKEKGSNKSDPHGVGVNEWLAASGEKKMASYEAEPVVLAEDSESADVTADLVDVGEGTKESDYAGKDVQGKIVLVSAQPGAVQDLAVGKFGAAGIVSYAQNQKTAWWGEDENLIRWGHLEAFSPNKTFGFMGGVEFCRWQAEYAEDTRRRFGGVWAGAARIGGGVSAGRGEDWRGGAGEVTPPSL
jgi:hypothetical protein